jgi:hypothetical protein
MRPANCVTCALICYLRLRRRWRERGAVHGQEPYLLIRPSRLCPWLPHVLVGYWGRTGRMLVWSYKPVNPAPLRWWQLHRAWRFDGRIVRGDQ